MKKTRILLISDMHYTTEQTGKELKKISPVINGSLANGPILGYTQKERMDFMMACIMYSQSDAFAENITREVTYQVKRLRNYSSIFILYCRMNHTLWMNYYLYTIQIHIKKPFRFHYF